VRSLALRTDLTTPNFPSAVARRFSGRRRSGLRRSLRWTGALYQADNITLDAEIGQAQWASAWVRWPSGKVDPRDDQLTPSDETLVRSIQQITVAWLGILSFTPPVSICCGLIAFDGGQYPEFYEASIFQEGASFVAPPNPSFAPQEDWIIRAPFQFVSDGSFATMNSERFIESRAMRKLPPNTGVLAVLAVDNLTASPATVTLTWSWDVRVCMKSGYTA